MTRKPPSLLWIRKELRELYSQDFDECVGLAWWPPGDGNSSRWSLEVYGGDVEVIGREWVPSHGQPFDATAAARRLLSDLRAHLSATSATA